MVNYLDTAIFDKHRRWLGMALLAIYACFYFLPEVAHLHQHAHHQDELHSEAAETDACHRAIYHNDFTAGCDHEYHLSQRDDDCERCAVCIGEDQIVVHGEMVSPTLLIRAADFPLCVTLSTRFALRAAARAPPVRLG